ncbi:TOTE conflict system archaeo-eukaryotic primase domain-containing protein [Desulfobacter sp.]|uniref:TOTE conflict system archaeo-eukaryotic primase domain-containing protein n=1 Tax=Desulfobacter sp. TaxID=2294 RepID=UPI003D0BB072
MNSAVSNVIPMPGGLGGTQMDINGQIRLFRSIFKGREDVVPEYWKSKRQDGKAGYSPICANKWDDDLCNLSPKNDRRGGCGDCKNADYVRMSDDLIKTHLAGGKILGVYPLIKDHTCHFIAADFDKHRDTDPEPLPEVKKYVDACDVQEIPCTVFRSKSGKGYHVYIFFEAAVPAWKARAAAFALLKEAGVIGDDEQISTFDRLFPNQSNLSGKGLGNLISMPFQYMAGTKGHTIPLDPGTDFEQPYPDPWAALAQAEKASENQLDDLIAEWDLKEEIPTREKSDFQPIQEEEHRAIFSRIKQGCQFIKHCCDDSETLPEPEWYAFLTIVTRCKDGRRQAHKYSENHPAYDHADTERKIEHALNDTGPYMCSTILGQINGKHCGKCSYRHKGSTPLRLGEAAANDDFYIDVIKDMNSRHAVVMLGSKCQIMTNAIDPALNRPDVVFSSVYDIKNFYANKKIPDPDNPQKQIPKSQFWFEHGNRREYQGVVFDPSGTPEGYYNLWQGFAVEPAAGDWSLFKQHIWENIAACDEEIYWWILAWFARIIQSPGGERPGTSLVMRGRQGTGKGILMKHIGALLGKHYLQIAQSNQVTGNFNSHLKDALLVFVDEGFWAGDKQAEGVLKNMITEPFVNIEQKGKDIIRVKNHINLAIASNNSWVIPAGLEERRFFVVDVSDRHMQDYSYFAAIDHQMKNGGQAAMMHDLLNLDMSGVNLRTFKRTDGLFEQILNSMTTVQKYWFERLQDGSLRRQIPDGGWVAGVSKVEQYADYLGFVESIKERYPKSRDLFFTELQKITPPWEDTRPWVCGQRVRIRKYGTLEDCRKRFEDCVKCQIKWDQGDTALVHGLVQWSMGGPGGVDHGNARQ